MDKRQFLDLITEKARNNLATKQEVTDAYEKGSQGNEVKNGRVVNNTSVAGQVFAYIGGAIMFLALVIFVGQYWDLLNDLTRVLLTLGVGIAVFVSAVLLDKHSKVAAQALHLMAALLLPSGIAVMLYSAGVDLATFGAEMAIFFSLFLVYLAMFFINKKTIFLLFSIIFGTFCFYIIGDYISVNSYFASTWQYNLYLTFGLGLAYCFMGYSVTQLRGALYGFGILATLGSAFALTGWGEDKILAYELIYPALLVLTLWLSVKLKSRAFLVFGSIFLVGFIFKVTAEYFTDTFGWPIILAVIGLALVGVSVLAVNLKSRIAQK